jgi:DNA-binding NarL/FixJ family response regulator
MISKSLNSNDPTLFFSLNANEGKNAILKFVVADDHPVVRRGISNVIDQHWDKVTISFAEDFAQLLTLLKEPTDLLILDINIPGGNHFSMIEKIRSFQPSIKILVFSSYSESIYGCRYLQEGANGYLHKSSAETEIIKAVKTVLDGKKYASIELKDRLLETLEGGNMSADPISRLSNREMEVGVLLANGWGVLEISNVLKLQMGTVSTYKMRLYEKLGVKTIVDFIHKFQLYS